MDIELRGAGGEPVDLLRTFVSHGVADLPPLFVDARRPSLTVTLRLRRSVRTVVVAPGREGFAVVTVKRSEPPAEMRGEIEREIRRVLRLDEDLSEFYGMAADDPMLSWVTRGAGRLIRSQSVFEETVKTVCTTNCAWSATEKMVGALVEHLGTRAPGAPASGAAGRAFPTARAMADAGEEFYRAVAKAGYRGAYLRALAEGVAAGDTDLEELDRDASPALPDDEVERRLLRLPGVGPYAAAHVMMMLGRYSRLVLDSWTRPKVASLLGRDTVPDAEIRGRFQPYGRYAGLAFWLFLTRDWVDEEGSA
ncbi:MAG: DNA-3-methyladenine glycosylase 2 family protein [Deltaproteobacteria bacterium]|nr:DNA-3-methyladenine glycosylase 2 family protein [Deltaproteobacteria bacterium]